MPNNDLDLILHLCSPHLAWPGLVWQAGGAALWSHLSLFSSSLWSQMPPRAGTKEPHVVKVQLERSGWGGGTQSQCEGNVSVFLGAPSSRWVCLTTIKPRYVGHVWFCQSSAAAGGFFFSAARNTFFGEIWEKQKDFSSVFFSLVFPFH